MAVSDSDLIVEDGTGVVDANTYIDRTDSAEYHRLRGNSLWAVATENDQVLALIRATQYIDTRWHFRGVIFVEDQGLIFPRESLFYDRNGFDVSETVPEQIEDATCEYALIVLGDGVDLVDLAPIPDQSDPGSITMKREKVGPIEEETRYKATSGLRTTLSYPLADKIITTSGYLRGDGSGGTIR